jgi:hypothetical protein
MIQLTEILYSFDCLSLFKFPYKVAIPEDEIHPDIRYTMLLIELVARYLLNHDIWKSKITQ